MKNLRQMLTALVVVLALVTGLIYAMAIELGQGCRFNSGFGARSAVES